MDEPVYFVIQQYHGREFPAIIRGPLPQWLKRKTTEFEKPPIVYLLRIDNYFPADILEWWLKQPLDFLYNYYKSLRSQNKLPVNR